jgi:excisionase family DNA binding protein
MKNSNVDKLETSTSKIAYSIDEVAGLSGICRTLIYAEINNGRLSARKCGRRTLVFRQDLLGWLDLLPSYCNRGPIGGGK